jgi:mycofactocin precursor
LARANCPVRELPEHGKALMFARQVPMPVRKKGLDEVTADQSDRDQENVVEIDELLVEEVSIDGMCGVY